MSDIRVVAFERLQLAFALRAWPFAAERRADIDRHFAQLQRERPMLWNGRVLLLHDHAIEAGTFHGSFFETDFASFIAWRDWGFPDGGVTNCFSAGALRTSDGSYVLGVMGAHTANAGMVYFPSGTPEPRDVVDGSIDMTSSVTREVAEETGLAAGDYDAEPGWCAVLAGPRIALIKVLHVDGRADELHARIGRHLTREVQPELADVRIVRGPGDLDPMMPDFITAFLLHHWR